MKAIVCTRYGPPDVLELKEVDKPVIGSRKLGSLTMKPNQDLVFMKELIEAGKVKPVIDRCFPLSETADAFRYYGEGHSRGKVAITLKKQIH